MAIRTGHRSASLLRFERPRFGEFARRVAGVSSEQLAECLEQQAQEGGRLGEILRRRGLISRAQITQILRLQARWLARALQADVAPHTFPFRSFLSVCMPAYNEEQNIEDTLDSACAILPAFVKRFEIVVVNDGSRDRTGEIVARYSLREPRVRLVTHEQNRGYGGAVTTALRAAHGDLVMFTDSDGQFSLLDLPQVLVQLKGHDMVIGYRYQRADNWMRLLNAWSWNRLIRLVLGVCVRDLDCAFKLFPRKIVDRLVLNSSGAAINAEILVQCFRSGVRICETPVMHYPRYAGAPTGAALKVILKAFRELPRLWKYRFTPPFDLADTGLVLEPAHLNGTAAEAGALLNGSLSRNHKTAAVVLPE
jgi:hypothetical protein